MSIIFYDEEAYFEKISWRFKREYALCGQINK